MTRIQITYGSQNLSQLTGDSGLTCTRITCQHNMHRHLLELTQTTFSTLHIVLYRQGHLTNSLLHIGHSDKAIQIAEYLVECTLFWNIASDILTLHHRVLCAPTDE